MADILANAVHTLLGPPVSGRSFADAASVVRAARADELARLAAVAGAESVGLARGLATALTGAPPARVVETVRTTADGTSRATAIELARVSLAAARCHRELEGMLGASDALDRIRRATFVTCFGPTLLHARRVARVIRDHDVLVTGETGTGKERVAAAILAGALGGPSGAPAARAELNVAAVPETLIESELFGHRKGAFTGAVADRKGSVRTADGGCLFLDEIGELPLPAQVKLLRVIETDRVQPVGSDQVHQVDVRFVGATHRDLPAQIAQGRFRQDLYQRLAGTVLHVPPLRERPEDVVVIGDRFLDEFAIDGMLDPEIRHARRWLRSPAAARHPYVGNVRELKNVLRNLLLGLPSGILPPLEPPPAEDEVPEAIRECRMRLVDVEAWYLDRAVLRSGGNLAAAARILGVDRTTVARRLRAGP